MDKSSILKKLILDTGRSMRQFSIDANLPYTTLMSILKRGVGRASVDNVLLICKELNITIDDLEKLSLNSTIHSSQNPDNMLLKNFHQLNQEGQEKVLEYIQLLIKSGQYIKSRKSTMVD